MASLDSLLTRQTLEKGVVRQVLIDKAVGLRLRYVGSSTVTSVVVVQADSLVLTTAAATDTFLFDTAAGYTTLGGLADAINDTGRWEAKVVDALRSEDPDDFFLATSGTSSATTDENGVVCYDLLIDTSAAATIAACLSPNGPNFDMPEGHRVHLKQIDYIVDNTAAAGTLKIYKRKGSAERLVYSAINVDGSLTSVSWASGHGKITGGPDEEIIVFFDGTVIDTLTQYVCLTGIYE